MLQRYKVLICSGGLLLGTYTTSAPKHIGYINITDFQIYDATKPCCEPAVTLTDTAHIYACAHRYDVLYTTADGRQTLRKGGSRAWRNNNPGCIRSGQFAYQNGAIGHAGGFAIFPDEEAGLNAICALLRSDKYINKTIAAAIYSYAPPCENNTAAYNSNLRKLTGLSTNLKLRDLNDEQIRTLAYAIKKIEGWNVGIEKKVTQDTVNMARLNQAKQYTL